VIGRCCSTGVKARSKGAGRQGKVIANHEADDHVLQVTIDGLMPGNGGASDEVTRTA